MDERLNELVSEWDEELVEFGRALDLLYVMSEAVRHEDMDLTNTNIQLKQERIQERAVML